jgi:hypothetical protein
MRIYIRGALAAIVSLWNLRTIFYKNYTDIFYVVCERKFPSFQRNKTLDWSASLEEVDGLFLILTDLNFPALTPRLH